MAKKAENRQTISLACGTCKERNYVTSKNRQNDKERLEIKKYCRRCRVHTPHRETR